MRIRSEIVYIQSGWALARSYLINFYERGFAMITFLICLTILIVGYFTYGKIVNKIIGPDDSFETPAMRMADGVDYVELPWWKVLLTQFLNIAGVGPIFGAISGAMFGPVAFLWITFGCLFVGAVHDFLSGYISLKHDGLSISEIVGLYLGKHARAVMRVFTVVLLMLVGVVFTMAPANWLQSQMDLGLMVWVGIILIYYIVATIVPINTLIAKLFPIFSASMILMCVMLFIAVVVGQINGTVEMMEFTLDFPHPQNLSVLPFIFVTIACGAVSGFHATKSPMMARCLKRESESQRVFYGAMVIEGIVALVWAAVAMALVGDRFMAGETVGAMGGPGNVVDMLSRQLLPEWIALILIVIAIIIVPVTSGDTTFRSIRLLLSDAFKWDQSTVKSRVMICIPIFAVAFALTLIDFDVVWRYFAWSNQTIAAIALWTGAAFLVVNKKFHWIATIPATFLSFISVSYIMQAPDEGFGLPMMISNVTGAVFATVLLILFLVKAPNMKIHTDE